MEKHQPAIHTWQLLPGLVLCASLCAALQTQTTLAKADEANTTSVTIKTAPPLPDAPSYLKGGAAIVHNSPDTQEPKKPGFWTMRKPPDDPPLRTNMEILRDKTFVAAQSFYLGSIAYDVELTHQGLAHHKCVEDSSENPHPSRGDLYRGHIMEYSVGTVWDWLVMKYIGKYLVLEWPAMASVEHLRGGSKWLMSCW